MTIGFIGLGKMGGPIVAAAVTDTWRECDRTLPGSDFTEIWRYVSTR